MHIGNIKFPEIPEKYPLLWKCPMYTHYIFRDILSEFYKKNLQPTLTSAASENIDNKKYNSIPLHRQAKKYRNMFFYIQK